MPDQLTDLKAKWDENKAQFERLCTEQEDLYNPEFESVFTALYEIDPDQRKIYNTRGWDIGATLPEAVETDTLNQALQAVGVVGDEAARFVRYAEVVLQGKKIMQANALLNLQIEMEKHQLQHTERISPEGWRFARCTLSHLNRYVRSYNVKHYRAMVYLRTSPRLPSDPMRH